MIGQVLAIAIRPAHGEPMRDVTAVTATKGGGLVEEGRKVGAKRGVSLLAAGQWPDVCEDLGLELPWTARRANLLIDCDDLSRFEGMTLCIGEHVKLRVSFETKPCAHIESLTSGIRKALTPAWRGGVCCEILEGGAIAIGDTLEVVDE